MSSFRDYQFNRSQVTAIAIDTSNGQFLWIAYALKSGTCLLQKVSAHDLTQVYFSIPLSVTSINSIVILGPLLYVAVTHATEAVYLFDIGAPLSEEIRFFKSDLSLTESPIEVVSSITNVYFLTPGNESGNVAQIAVIDDAGEYVETINLIQSPIEITNAISLAVDSNEYLWVVTDGDPTILYRVFFQSAEWQIQETIFE